MTLDKYLMYNKIYLQSGYLAYHHTNSLSLSHTHVNKTYSAYHWEKNNPGSGDKDFK